MQVKNIMIFFILVLMIAPITYAQDVKHLNLKKEVAVQGYDLVSYFDSNPQEGRSAYSTTFEGVIYFFASSINKNKFEENPSTYLPMYGGWCAYAMGKNSEKVKVDPETYKIVSDKLYLFYNFYFNNTLESWNEDQATLKKKADLNWERIMSK